MVGVVSAGLVIFLRTEVPSKVYTQTVETIEVTPNPLKFGNIAPNSSLEKTVTVKNTLNSVVQFAREPH
jgi:hypothetical protein